MHEFVSIPTSIISELLDNKTYSKADALLDLLSMADENGVFRITARELKSKWGWGSSKVVAFLKTLEEWGLISVILKDKNGTEYRTNDLCKPFTGTLTGTQVGTLTGTLKPLQTLALQAPAGTQVGTLTGTQVGTLTEHKFSSSISQKEAFQSITDAWNSLADYNIAPLPLTGITSLQYDSIKALAREYGVADILNTIERIKKSDFLQGKKSDWKISFNWFLEQKNYEKVRGGNYDNTGYVEDKITRGVYKTHNTVDSWLANREEGEDDRQRICSNSESD